MKVDGKEKMYMEETCTSLVCNEINMIHSKLQKWTQIKNRRHIEMKFATRIFYFAVAMTVWFATLFNLCHLIIFEIFCDFIQMKFSSFNDKAPLLKFKNYSPTTNIWIQLILLHTSKILVHYLRLRWTYCRIIKSLF